MNKTCKACGAWCCRTVAVGPVFESPPVSGIFRFMETRGVVHCGYWFVPSRCKHLATNGHCRIYAKRPEVCIKYEVDGPMCRATRAAMKGGG